jgi:hypothetical protein
MLTKLKNTIPYPPNLPVNTRENASHYLYLGRPIQPLMYFSESPYIVKEIPAKDITEHLGAYQLIDTYFPKGE